MAARPRWRQTIVALATVTLGCDDGRFYLSADDYNLSFMTCETGSKTGEFKILIARSLQVSLRLPAWQANLESWKRR